MFPVRAAIPVNLAIRATMHMEERSWMDDFNVANPTPFFFKDGAPSQKPGRKPKSSEK